MPNGSILDTLYTIRKRIYAIDPPKVSTCIDASVFERDGRRRKEAGRLGGIRGGREQRSASAVSLLEV